MRIGILARLKSHKNLNFYVKNIFQVGNRAKNLPTKVLKQVLKAVTRFICKLWSNTMLLDPDPDSHSQYGSGSVSRTAK
jgi:hypothetical protein